MTEFLMIHDDVGMAWAVNLDEISRVRIVDAGEVVVHVHDRLIHVVDADDVHRVKEMVETHQAKSRSEQVQAMMETIRQMVPYLFREAPSPYLPTTIAGQWINGPNDIPILRPGVP